jgi:hypothetical protein
VPFFEYVYELPIRVDVGSANITTKIAKRQKTQKMIPFRVFCLFAIFVVNPSIVDCRLLLHLTRAFGALTRQWVPAHRKLTINY